VVEGIWVISINRIRGIVTPDSRDGVLPFRTLPDTGNPKAFKDEANERLRLRAGLAAAP
jgi:hypothetical protein